VVTFQEIKNVGRGAALHVSINSMHEVGGRPTATLTTQHLPILATNETIKINGEIFVYWKNVQPDEQGHKYLPITIRILCWDSRAMCHETKYSLLAVESGPGQGVFVTDGIAPGVALAGRATVVTPVWLLKLRAKLARIPGLRKLCCDRK
jgi:hypothetical protein